MILLAFFIFLLVTYSAYLNHTLENEDNCDDDDLFKCPPHKWESRQQDEHSSYLMCKICNKTPSSLIDGSQL
jgi:hypothetical protein